MVMVDYRQPDERTYIRPTPTWIESAVIRFGGNAGVIIDDNDAVFMSFGVGDGHIRPIRIHECVVEVITAFVGGTPLIDVGMGTIPAVGDQAGAVVSITDVDALMTTAVLLPAATGFKQFDPVANQVITPADTTTPVAYATLVSGSPITAGELQIALLVSEVMF